jgi:nucleoside-diphosphate kinase
MSGPVYALLLEGENAIKRVKDLCGPTFPCDAKSNTIRGKYGEDSFEICLRECRAARNIIHAPESQDEYTHQIKIWFPDFTKACL